MEYGRSAVTVANRPAGRILPLPEHERLRREEEME